MNYLTDIPNHAQNYGFTKTLIVRMEEIALKHIETEIFVRKNINIIPMLSEINKTLFDYCTFMNERRRRIFRFSREIRVKDINNIVGLDKGSLFKTLDLYNNNMKNCIIFDYDGVVSDSKFKKLYNYIVDKYGKSSGIARIFINSANPDITKETLEKKGLSQPDFIFANKGKKKKINRFLQISKKYDNTFLIDDEELYLIYGWIFGLKTFRWDRRKEQIKVFNLYDDNFHKRVKDK